MASSETTNNVKYKSDQQSLKDGTLQFSWSPEISQDWSTMMEDMAWIPENGVHKDNDWNLVYPRNAFHLDWQWSPASDSWSLVSVPASTSYGQYMWWTPVTDSFHHKLCWKLNCSLCLPVNLDNLYFMQFFGQKPANAV